MCNMLCHMTNYWNLLHWNYIHIPTANSMTCTVYLILDIYWNFFNVLFYCYHTLYTGLLQLMLLFVHHLWKWRMIGGLLNYDECPNCPMTVFRPISEVNHSWSYNNIIYSFYKQIWMSTMQTHLINPGTSILGTLLHMLAAFHQTE